MNNDRKQRIWRFLKTSLLALAITIMLVMLVATSKQKSPKRHLDATRNLEQRISRLETTLSDNRELLAETKEANENLRSILSELRGIHNDCQRNVTTNFLHPPEQRQWTSRQNPP